MTDVGENLTVDFKPVVDQRLGPRDLSVPSNKITASVIYNKFGYQLKK